MEPGSAVTMMATQAAMAASSALQLNRYPKSPAKCDHTTGTGTRTYAAGGMRIRICDTCGSRWVLTLAGEALEAVPKANPNAKTALGLTDSQKQKLAKTKPKANASSEGKHRIGRILAALVGILTGAFAGQASSRLSAPAATEVGLGSSDSESEFVPAERTTSAAPTVAFSKIDSRLGHRHERGHDRQPWRTFHPRSRHPDNAAGEGQPQGWHPTPEELDEILLSQRDDPNLWQERMDRDDWDADDLEQMSPELRRELEQGCF